MALTLLLADDSITIQRVVGLMFADQDVKVVSVSDGQEAIDHLTLQRPDIALVGVSLLKRDGYEVAAFMKREPSLRGVPVLLLAGAFDTLDEADVRDSGAAGVLIKPLEPRQVINRVKELLGISAKQPARAADDPVVSSTAGRLVTSSDGPATRAAESEGAPADGPPPRNQQSWDQLRQDTGLAPDAAAVEGPGTGGDDYFEHLDAAFDSLDAQLAGRHAPPGRSTNPPPPARYPAAMDPGGGRPAAGPPAPGMTPQAERIAAPPNAVSSTFVNGPHLGPQSAASDDAKPVFEIDDQWFSPRDAGRTEAPDAASSSVSAPWPAVFAPPSSDAREHTPAPHASHAMAAPAPPPPTAPVTFAAARSESAASHGGPSPKRPDVGPAPPAMADAFALMLAQEQGEPLPDYDVMPEQPQYHGGPIDLSDEIIERIAQRVADRLMSGWLGERVATTVNEVSERLVREEIARIRATASHKTP